MSLALLVKSKLSCFDELAGSNHLGICSHLSCPIASVSQFFKFLLRVIHAASAHDTTVIYD